VVIRFSIFFLLYYASNSIDNKYTKYYTYCKKYHVIRLIQLYANLYIMSLPKRCISKLRNPFKISISFPVLKNYFAFLSCDGVLARCMLCRSSVRTVKHRASHNERRTIVARETTSQAKHFCDIPMRLPRIVVPGKICDFRQITRHTSQKRYEIRPTVSVKGK